MMKKREGLVLWCGPSEIDGKPIVLLATTGSKESNRKTGRMIQTYILRSDLDPVEATRTGSDSSICGNCIHRKENLGSCYVRIDTGPLQVWRAFKRGTYARLTMEVATSKLVGEKVRLGSYGDPAAIPLHVWSIILKGTVGVTGYTHQWKEERFHGLAQYCMASCDNEAETIAARSKGWRTFTVIPKDTTGPLSSSIDQVPLTVQAKAFLCPASEEAGKKLTCFECMACGGLSSSNKASVFIPVHGVAFKQKRFNELIQIGRT